jgi:hypothetical protein
MVNTTSLAIWAIFSMILAMATITILSNSVQLAQASKTDKFCYHRPLAAQPLCFPSKGECIKAFRNDPLADSGCTKGKSTGS